MNKNLTSDKFVPWLYSSQPCEQLFRTTRSLTSTLNTVVNFRIQEIMNRIRRIETLNEIPNELECTSNTDDLSQNKSFIFPRSHKQSQFSLSVNKPNNFNELLNLNNIVKIHFVVLKNYCNHRVLRLEIRLFQITLVLIQLKN